MLMNSGELMEIVNITFLIEKSFTKNLMESHFNQRVITIKLLF